MYVPAIASGHKYDERKKSISGMNDLFIDFSNKEPCQFLNQTFPKKKINSITLHILWMPFSKNKQANKVDDDERIR